MCRSYPSLILICLFSLTAAGAQTVSGNMPDAPMPLVSSSLVDQQSSTQAGGTQSQMPVAASTEGKQTKRILGIVPNFRAVSADEKLPPQSVKDKFVTTSQDSFDYSAFIFAGLLAGVAQVQNSYPEFHQGAAGYGRYYWHSFADQAAENYMVEFILPATLHQDSRYYTLSHGGFVKRSAYSISRILITRTDSGNETFNASEIVGAGAAAGISSLYYPSDNRTWTKVGQHWVTNVGLDGITFVFKEFWPDINNAVFHQKQ